jgi:hypothetical protein
VPSSASKRRRPNPIKTDDEILHINERYGEFGGAERYLARSATRRRCRRRPGRGGISDAATTGDARPVYPWSRPMAFAAHGAPPRR